jgi:hypothetical protein
MVDIKTEQNVAYALWHNDNVVITKSQFDWDSDKRERKHYKQLADKNGIPIRTCLTVSYLD